MENDPNKHILYFKKYFKWAVKPTIFILKKIISNYL